MFVLLLFVIVSGHYSYDEIPCDTQQLIDEQYVKIRAINDLIPYIDKIEQTVSKFESMNDMIVC